MKLFLAALCLLLLVHSHALPADCVHLVPPHHGDGRCRGDCLYCSGDWSVSGIPDNLFDGVNKADLWEIRLDHINLKDVRHKAGLFSGLDKLVRLHLQGNAIQEVPAGVFQDLTYMTTLDLRWNQIRNIEVGAFDGLSRLSFLGLESNRLTNLPVGIFRGLPELMSLYIDQNALTTIHANTFEGLPRLFWLALEENKIESLATGAFAGLAKLNGLTIVLKDNPLTEVSAAAFNGEVYTGVLELADTQCVDDISRFSQAHRIHQCDAMTVSDPWNPDTKGCGPHCTAWMLHQGKCVQCTACADGYIIDSDNPLHCIPVTFSDPWNPDTKGCGPHCTAWMLSRGKCVQCTACADGYMVDSDNPLHCISAQQGVVPYNVLAGGCIGACAVAALAVAFAVVSRRKARSYDSERSPLIQP